MATLKKQKSVEYHWIILEMLYIGKTSMYYMYKVVSVVVGYLFLTTKFLRIQNMGRLGDKSQQFAFE